MFWKYGCSVGRLHISLVNNEQLIKTLEGLLGVVRPRSRHIILEHVGWDIFFTLRVRSFFLNIDWV